MKRKSILTSVFFGLVLFGGFFLQRTDAKTTEAINALCLGECFLRELFENGGRGSSSFLTPETSAKTNFPDLIFSNLNQPTTIFTVSNTNDAGAGSLRQAIIDANDTDGADTIDFTVSGTINLTSALPNIIDSVTINGNNATVAGNGTDFRIFTITSGLTVTINNLTIRDGEKPNGLGGCIYAADSTLNLINSTVTSCQAFLGFGGGIYATGGNFLMTGSVVSDNTADYEGGGLFLQVANARIENSTVSGNSSLYGGGIMAYSSLQMSNVTISGNSALGGGGFYNYGTTATLRNCTIANNSSASDGGGILNYPGRTTIIANTILTGNTATTGAEISNYETINYLGRNVIVGSVAGTTPPADTITADPNLGALQNNGGFVPTRMISVVSSAFNTGVNTEALDTLSTPLTTDARGAGFPRLRFGTVDIGAYEYGEDNLAISDITDQRIIENSNTGALMFFIVDGVTPVDDLAVSGNSSNTTLVPNGNIVFGGSGVNRTVTITPAANQTGSATITVTVTDGDGNTASDTFVLDVLSTLNLNVTNTNESGAGSLRQAILDANNIAGPNVIDFTITGTVNLASPLPDILDSVTINGNNSTVAQVNNNYGPFRIFTITSGLTVTINNLTMRRGFVYDLGGCIYAINSTLNLINSTVTDCSTEESNGGGIYVTGGSFLMIGSVVSNNYNSAVVVENPEEGGGLFLNVPNARIENSTISGNSSVYGGGIMNYGSLQMSNVTISGNSSYWTGGGLYNYGTTATLRNCTIVNNWAPLGGGGILNAPGSTTIIANTILAGNYTVTNEDGAEIRSGGTLTYLGRNVIVGSVHGTPPPEDTITVNPNLGGLLNNDGLVPTHAVPSASSARNTGVNAEALDTLSTPLTTDARGAGFPRIVSGTVDIGAYESAPIFLPPSISDISDQAIDEDTSTSAIPFTVGDNETPPASLFVTRSSSNTTLVPNNPANIILGGAGANRTIQLIPALNKFGTTIITVTVSDGEFTAQDSFVLTVNPVSDIPTISDITDQESVENTNTGALMFVINDEETLPAELMVSGSSSNTALVPNSNIVFGGSGADRTVTITPAANQSGTATITITVADGDGNTASDTFVLDVLSSDLNVTNTNDSGTGSLRQAITVANLLPGKHQINFNVSGTINLLSALPNITDSVTITGNNSIVAGNYNFRIFTITSGLTVTINNLTMRYGRVNDHGGCIYAANSTLNLINSTVTSCQAIFGNGGGIYASGGSFLMTGSVVSDNSADYEGGGLFLEVNNARIENSTISGNTSLFGGGIMTYGSMQMSNVTISGNYSASGGGGFYNFGTTATLRNCTIANNTAESDGGGILNYPGRTTTIANTILANNTAPTGMEISNYETFNYLGRNVIVGSVVGTNPPEDTITVNPNLGALQNNGGLVPTRAIPLTSSAYNAGIDSEALDTQPIPVSLTLDARGTGFGRTNAAVDIGAFERQLYVVTPTILPNGSIGQAYNNSLTAADGNSPYSFTQIGGTLPTGLSLNANGTWSGLPSAAGIFNFTVQVNDSSLFAKNENLAPMQTSQKNFQIQILAPTAAAASVSGKVLSGKNGIARAIVSLTDSSGSVRTVKTNSFGNFRFEGITAGSTVIVQVTAKSYAFAPQILTLNEAIENLDFTALE